jgi:hypothetical protein
VAEVLEASEVDATEVTHVFITKDPDGFFGESPQIPGFCYGRPTETEFRRDFQSVLKDVGVRGQVQAHFQTRGVIEDGREFVLRFADGAGKAERIEVTERVERCLRSDQAADMLSTTTTPMGEVVFVAALPADTLGMFMDQLYDKDDALVISAAVADDGLFTMTLASGVRTEDGWESVSDYGWTRETRVSQLLMESSRGRRVERVLV